MNDIIKKYAEILKEMVLKAEEKDLDHLTDLFAKKLYENGHLSYSKSIVAEARRLAYLDIIKRKVLVRSAKKLSKEEKEALFKDMKEKYGEDLIYEEVVDQNLISGIVVELRGMRIDMSMFGRIKKLKEHLI